MKPNIESIMTDIEKYACMIVNEKERKKLQANEKNDKDFISSKIDRNMKSRLQIK
jgi:hypothetical protein